MGVCSTKNVTYGDKIKKKMKKGKLTQTELNYIRRNPEKFRINLWKNGNPKLSNFRNYENNNGGISNVIIGVAMGSSLF